MGLKNNYSGATLQMWRFFIHAVEAGSLSKAAEICGTDVAYLSREIRKLELIMGEALLERSKKGVKPTWPGGQRYRMAISVVHDFERLLSGFSRPQHEAPNTIHIAAPVSLSGLFVKWIASFKSFPNNQNLHIDLVEYTGEPLQDLNLFDVFICEKELPRVRVLAEQLGYVKRAIVASSDFLKSEPALNIPEDLIGRSLIAEKSERVLMLARGENTETTGSHEKYFQSIALPIEPTIKVNSPVALAETVRTGIGYAIGVPVWQISDQLSNGELVQVLPRWSIAANPVWLMRPSSGSSDEKLKSLCRFFRECWGHTQGLDTSRPSFHIKTEVH